MNSQDFRGDVGKRDSHMTMIVERNIRALLTRRQAEEKKRTVHEKMADRITRFTGSMPFVYLHIFIFGLWIAVNLPWVPLPHFDPTFVVLAMFASVEAIFLSTFILITQNHMSEMEDKRADLDLQVSLLAEHEVTRLISLVAAIAQKMGIEESRDPELAELARDVRPEKVLDAMERDEGRLSHQSND